MRVLVIGGGAREHAIIWKLAQSSRRPELFAAPGNAGSARLAVNLPVRMDDFEGLVAAARDHAIDLTIVGPEAPLVAGVVDRFEAEGLRIFGPTQAAARIEGSKSFSKQTMRAAGVPTAEFGVFDDPAEARAHVRSHGAPIVVKADGLAAGKGVVVAQTVEEALAAVDGAMIEGAFGAAGARLVLEDCLVGQEVSVFCFTDGVNVTPLVAACDYKRALDGDLGPNTGGVGGYSPPPWWNEELEERIRLTCIEPVIRELAAQGAPFSGVLYGGLMLTAEGPSVIEYNARLGDPETQLILPLLENDLLDVIDAVLDGGLDRLELRWSDEQTVCVVLSPGGYPGDYEIGKPVHGLGTEDQSSVVFHAGTAERDGSTVTNGGRAFAVVGRAATMAEARRRAYEAAAVIDFEGKQLRSDIAAFAAG